MLVELGKSSVKGTIEEWDWGNRLILVTKTTATYCNVFLKNAGRKC